MSTRVFFQDEYNFSESIHFNIVINPLMYNVPKWSDTV